MSGDAIEWTLRAIRHGRLTVEDLAMLVPYAQRELGVDDDGKAGLGTLAALHAALGTAHTSLTTSLPVPKGRKELVRVYGDPSWVKLPRGRAVDLDDAWEHANIRSFKLHTGRRVRMHWLVGDEFARVFKEACERSGYTPKSVQTFNPRIIGGTDRLSTHAYGIAADFDPALNPWGAREKLGDRSPLIKNPAFLETFRRAGWCCGADWKKGDGDWMHVQRAFP